jgi:hypothetical protein
MQAAPIVWWPMEDWALSPSPMPLRVVPATLGGSMQRCPQCASARVG